MLSGRCRGEIRAFSDDFALEVVSVVFRDGLCEVAWDEDIAGFEANVFRLDGFRVAGNAASLVHVGLHVVSVNA